MCCQVLVFWKGTSNHHLSNDNTVAYNIVLVLNVCVFWVCVEVRVVYLLQVLWWAGTKCVFNTYGRSPDVPSLLNTEHGTPSDIEAYLRPPTRLAPAAW